jgi:hypothetical protein
VEKPLIKRKQSLDKNWKQQSTITCIDITWSALHEFSLINFHRMSATIFREIISHCGDGNSTKMYPAEVKTELWGFITFHDTMKTHEIIENDCEDFMWALVTKLKLIYNNMKDLKQLRDQRPHTSLRRPRPFSHQKVTMGGHFPSCFRK